MTASGGGGIMAADRAEVVGLDVPALAPDVRRRLDALIPGGNSRNPVDVTAMVLTDMELMVAPIAEVVQAGNIDALIVFLTSAFRSEASIDRLIARLHAHGLHRCGKPVLLTLFTSPQGHARLHAAGFPSFLEPVRAVETLAAWRDWSDRSASIAYTPMGDEAPFATSIATPIALPAARDEAALLAWFGAHGVPVAPSVLVHSAAEAALQAQALGPVVAMKVSLPGLAHKSELNGVMLGIRTADAATDAWLTLRDRGAACIHAAHDEAMEEAAVGVVVQRQMRGVIELMLGMRRDPTFGPVVLVGLGGQWVELLDDVTIRVAPVSAGQARGMLESLRGFQLLRGARGRPMADLEAATAAIVAFSQIAARVDGLASAEINPFIVGEASRGGWAVDAKIVAVTAETAATPLAQALPPGL